MLDSKNYLLDQGYVFTHGGLTGSACGSVPLLVDVDPHPDREFFLITFCQWF